MRGLLIINLGSPESPAPADVRSFLREFLSDRRVIDFPRALWLPILHGIVLRVRPKKSGALYETIWMEEGSPLVIYTKRQHEILTRELPEWNVKYAMTYTTPSIAESLQAFADEGVEDITILPLYPQWAPSTTGAICDQVFAFYKGRVDVPWLRIVGAHPTERTFVSWYAKQIAHTLASQPEGERAQRIVLSYHGVPDRPVHRNDGYRAECVQTTSAIADALGELGITTPIMTTFQSKFGPGEWLKPATIGTMAELPTKGITSVLVATPGFIADCIETIDELDVLNQDAFRKAGGQHYVRVAPINDDPVFADIVKGLIATV